MPHLRRILRAPLLILAFLWVVLEETIWRWAGQLGAAIARLPVFAGLERLVARLDARIVLLLFLLPLLALIPLKLAAVWLIGGGHAIKGVMLLVSAKFLGTAVSAHLYALAEPKLMTIAAFARVRNVVVGLLARAHAYLEALRVWQAVRRAKAMARVLAARVHILVFGDGPGLIGRVRAVRARWRHRA
ncbi:hypothetical protein GXW78_23315 [Roseomonas terrae]|uniref:ABC transmembrane type-1 domain-containing protein n=1 Tax=Neoroseomonas terrae TaxID=424799 RepID=A0ABS5ENK9_9PROT|nr:hypothetical protein [Neoroseomonas terrae]MBR0652606.1 hypothetical protein [Neoroseomonas terrae]